MEALDILDVLYVISQVYNNITITQHNYAVISLYSSNIVLNTFICYDL